MSDHAPLANQPLSSPAAVRALLAHYGLRADKRFGQNFLIDSSVLESIIRAADIQPTDTVLEVGPGLGVLTQALVQRAGHVISIELDARLLPLLQQTIGQHHPDTFDLVAGDALRYPYHQMPPASLLVANLPYNVATTLVIEALMAQRFRRLVFLVQKEVAERLCAEAGAPAYGALSLLCQHFARAEIIRHVKPSAFMPAPKVTSSVVRLQVNLTAAPDPDLFALIKLGFRHRRKTLKKNLLMAGMPPKTVQTALALVGVDAKARAENLSLHQFKQLQHHLR